MAQEQLVIETFREQRGKQANVASEDMKLEWAQKVMVGEVGYLWPFRLNCRIPEVTEYKCFGEEATLWPSSRLGNLAKP